MPLMAAGRTSITTKRFDEETTNARRPHQLHPLIKEPLLLLAPWLFVGNKPITSTMAALAQVNSVYSHKSYELPVQFVVALMACTVLPHHASPARSQALQDQFVSNIQRTQTSSVRHSKHHNNQIDGNSLMYFFFLNHPAKHPLMLIAKINFCVTLFS